MGMRHDFATTVRIVAETLRLSATNMGWHPRWSAIQFVAPRFCIRMSDPIEIMFAELFFIAVLILNRSEAESWRTKAFLEILPGGMLRNFYYSGVPTARSFSRAAMVLLLCMMLLWCPEKKRNSNRKVSQFALMIGEVFIHPHKILQGCTLSSAISHEIALGCKCEYCI